jgi:NIMA (never in mitosis gene a)-related kinase
LKTENILLSGLEDRVVKLTDFGIAKVLGSQQDMAATIVGTPHTLSPELVQGQPYDSKSDVWALGCVLYELCALKKPFDASNLPAIIFAIMRNRPRALPEHYSPALREMVALLLNSDPASRPSLPEIEALPVVQAAISRWKEDYRRLERAAGLVPAAAAAGATTGGMPSARTGAEALPGATPLTAGGAPEAFPLGASTLGAGGVVAVAGSATLGSAPMTPSSTAGAAVPAHLLPMSPAAGRQAALAFERDMLREIDDLAGEAESAAGAAGPAALHARISELQARLDKGPPVSGKVWEGVGRAWADCGQFNRAIMAYRRSLRAKSANASLVAMEQLGNLLVRRAQQVWAVAKAGDPDGALKAAEDALAGSSGNALLQRITAKQARVPAKRREASSSAAALDDAAAAAHTGIAGSGEDSSATSAGEEEEPAWRRAASALMYEGLAYIERMCSLGSTAERRSLLGSAYKRRAWTGLGDSRKEDLVQAAANYAAAHELELEEGKEHPSPYARLNQLTLEMLAGNGTDEEKAV